MMTRVQVSVDWHDLVGIHGASAAIGTHALLKRTAAARIEEAMGGDGL
jgi:hypothetical protein